MRWRSGGARRRHHLRGVLRVARERLLHQHVFAAGERGRAPLEVRRRRQRDVHEVDVIAGDELGITTEGQRNGVLRGEVLRAFEIAGGDGDDFRAEQGVGGSHDAAWRDPRRAQYSNAYHGRQSRMSAGTAAHCRRGVVNGSKCDESSIDRRHRTHGNGHCS